MLYVIYDFFKTLFIGFLKACRYFGFAGLKWTIIITGILAFPAMLYYGILGGIWFLGWLANNETFQDFCLSKDGMAHERALNKLGDVVKTQQNVTVLTYRGTKAYVKNKTKKVFQAEQSYKESYGNDYQFNGQDSALVDTVGEYEKLKK